MCNLEKGTKHVDDVVGSVKWNVTSLNIKAFGRQ